MRIDTALPGDVDTRPAAAHAEAVGFDGIWAGEVRHDPFLGLGLAASATDRVTLGSSIAVSFARSPMSTAVLADDLQAFSNGRFVLGLGSQVKAHITRRFSMPWSQPVRRMHEYVSALREIWKSWHDDTPLDFHGDFYRHTLMPPMFRPQRHGHGPPAVLLAGVGPAMTTLAGRVADGFLCHSFSTEASLRTVTLPALARGRGGDIGEYEIVGTPFIVVGRTEAELSVAKSAVRSQIAFYGSTPAYRDVLDVHGWGALGDELHDLSTSNRWPDMAELISDEVLETFAAVGDPAEVGRQLAGRYCDVLTRMSLCASYPLATEVLMDVVAATRSALDAADRPEVRHRYRSGT